MDAKSAAMLFYGARHRTHDNQQVIQTIAYRLYLDAIIVPKLPKHL